MMLEVHRRIVTLASPQLTPPAKNQPGQRRYTASSIFSHSAPPVSQEMIRYWPSLLSFGYSLVLSTLNQVYTGVHLTSVRQ
ncbi:hypothetical protein PM082_003919 [Marasmius tenuissimus]|nr:hypothetical protein PM082_003919 [Marasmius tenuissimus]